MNAPEPIVTEGIQTIRVARIGASPTNPRKHFDQAALDELAESIRRHGVLQPILVRPNPDRMRGPREEFEIVSGERRWRAAQAAELREIPALVRELGDAEVLEIQVIENLQRADLHPLEEAEGYEALHQRHGYTVADIAAKVGKSERYVYARMKLCALCEKARKAFYAGKLSPTTALLVARIPDAGLQAKATAEITEAHWSADEGMTARQASEHIQRTYMLRLATAPFSTTDADLVPEAGPCTTCPKRTGNAGELFDDIKGPDTCTDPACFERKTIAHKDRLVERAQAKGVKVIDGKDAQKLFEHLHSAPKGYVDLDQQEYRLPGAKKARAVVGKAEVERVLLVNPHTHAVIEAVPEKAYETVLTERGVKSTRDIFNAEQAKERARLTLEKAYRRELFDALREPREHRLEDRRLIARAMFGHLGSELQGRIRDVWSWPKVAGDTSGIDELDAGQLDRLMMDMALVNELQVWTHVSAKPDRMLALAERLGVDAAAIKRQVQAEARAKKKPAKKAETKVKKAETKGSQAETKTARKPAPKAGGEPTRKRKAKVKAAASGTSAADAWPFPTAPATKGAQA